MTDQIAVDTDGVYINPQRIGGTEWMALLETTLVSAAAKDEAVSVLTEIIDAECRTLPPTVTFHTNSMGHIISTGSDDCDPTPFGRKQRPSRTHGYAQAPPPPKTPLLLIFDV